MVNIKNTDALYNCVVQIADDHLIIGHRLSEWCGHAPMLDEDLSMPNMALDMLGQCRHLYSYAASLEGKGRSEDDLAYLRVDREYRNCLLVEKPNTDFAHTMLRQLYFATFMQLYWQALGNSRDETLVGIAGKAEKEVAYHVRHAGEWVVRLGDGTQHSAMRMQTAVDHLHGYAGELFKVSGDYQHCIDAELLPDPRVLQAPWQQCMDAVFKKAQLSMPDAPISIEGGRDGLHTESFGYLLAELQYMQRSYPGLAW